MTITNVLSRIEFISKKYEKYDVELQERSNTFNNDAFMRLYSAMEKTMFAIEQKSNDVSIEENRAVAASMNAEIRKAKSAIREEFPKLEKLALRKVYGVSKEELLRRPEMVADLIRRIESIPDGFHSSAGNGLVYHSASSKRTTRTLLGTKKPELKMGTFVNSETIDPSNFEMTEEVGVFRKEFDERRMNQDKNLDAISSGLTTLRNMAQDLNEEMDKQAPLMDEIETKIDLASTNLISTNKRLKDSLHQVRSGRKVIMDVILICVLLGIGATLYKMIRK